MNLLNKWKKTGLLDKLPETDQEKLAIVLERTALWLKLRKRNTRVDSIILPIVRKIFEGGVIMEPKQLYDYINGQSRKFPPADLRVCFGSYTNMDAEAEFCYVLSEAIINNTEPVFPDRMNGMLL